MLREQNRRSSHHHQEKSEQLEVFHICLLPIAVSALPSKQKQTAASTSVIHIELRNVKNKNLLGQCERRSLDQERAEGGLSLVGQV
jgi:hypothetical protein